MAIERRKMVFVLAYSGVFVRCFGEGDFDVCFAYSDGVFSKTF